MIGRLIKEEMQRKCIKARFIAEKADIHEGALSLILNNKANPTVDTVDRIIKAMDGKLVIKWER